MNWTISLLKWAFPSSLTNLAKLLEIIFLCAIVIVFVRIVLLIFFPSSVASVDIFNNDRRERLDNNQKPALVATMSNAEYFNPFHRDDVGQDLDDAQANASHENVPQTKLNIKLFGVRSGVYGAAIVQVGNEDQKWVAQGEEIQPGVTFVSAEQFGILLRYNGRTEKLIFDERATYLPSSDHQGGAAKSDPSAIRKSANLEYMRSLGWNIRLTRFEQDGEYIGLKIQKANESAELSRYGIMDGDVLMRVNGEQISTQHDAFARLAASLQSRRSIQADVLRNGSVISIQLGR